MKIFVACHDSSGIPTFVSYDIAKSGPNCGAGYETEEAVAAARDDGYTGPFIAYDEKSYEDIINVAAEIAQIE